MEVKSGWWDGVVARERLELTDLGPRWGGERTKWGRVRTGRPRHGRWAADASPPRRRKKMCLDPRVCAPDVSSPLHLFASSPLRPSVPFSILPFVSSSLRLCILTSVSPCVGISCVGITSPPTPSPFLQSSTRAAVQPEIHQDVTKTRSLRAAMRRRCSVGWRKWFWHIVSDKCGPNLAHMLVYRSRASIWLWDTM
jgi:hypothetical protein